MQREFSTLATHSKIYKLVGPVLLKQDPEEAKRTVEGRLQFIGKEIGRVEGLVREGEGRGEKVRGEVGRVQGLLQQQQQQGQG